MIYDVLVIGGGPAGCMAAVTAAGLGKKVVVIERNGKIGKKLSITGKGRCNLTNNCDIDTLMRNIPVNPKFLYSCFSMFDARDSMNFFESLGVPLKTERGGRVFPASDKASDIVNALDREMKRLGVGIISGRAKKLIIRDNRCSGVLTYDGKEYLAKCVLVACGGRSYPATGSDGDGYKFASQAGHTVTELKPSLVPLVSEDEFCAELTGLSLKNVVLRLYDGEKCIFSELGEMLFTHFGVSGPLVLTASSHIREMRPGRYHLLIDLKPGLTEEMLDKRIRRDFSENLNRDFVNGMKRLLPAKMIPVIAEISGIPPDCKINGITREQRKSLEKAIKSFPVGISGFRPIEEAIITSGGVKTDEIDPKTMESKLLEGLYFAGEVIDTDAYTGGFNLQIAFSTGYCAGISMSRKQS